MFIFFLVREDGQMMEMTRIMLYCYFKNLKVKNVKKNILIIIICSFESPLAFFSLVILCFCLPWLDDGSQQSVTTFTKERGKFPCKVNSLL